MTVPDSATMKQLKGVESYLSRWVSDAVVSPDIALQHLEKKLERQLDRWFPTKESLFEALAKGYESIDLTQTDIAKRAKYKTLGRTSEATFFWEQLCLIEKLYPGSPLLLIHEPVSLGRAKLRSLSTIHRAKNVCRTGEEKAVAALHALQFTFEALYRPYLVGLDKLRALLGGQKHHTNQKPGVRVRVLGEHFDSKQLVDVNLVQMRNAASHCHFRYIGRRRIHLWNESNSWEIEATTSQLLDLAEGILTAVSGFEKATQLYAFMFTLELLLPVLPHMVPLLRGQLSDDQVARINREYVAHERELLQYLPDTKKLIGMTN